MTWIVSTLEDALIRFNLPLSNLKGQIYHGASMMMGHKSEVAEQIKKDQPKVLETHCRGHALSFSVKDMTKQSELLNDVIDTVGEVTVLAKYSPNCKQLLESFQSYLQCDDNDESFEQNTSHSKLCVTRWIVRATTCMSILTNYESLIKLWDTSLECFTDRRTQARIVACHAQMANFESQADFFIV